jgi:hypothetical protein
VNVAPILEMLNVSPVATRAPSLAQVSGQVPPTFKESLLAASKASSSTGAANQTGTGTGRRQKPVSQDAKLPPSMPHVRAVQSTAPPQKTVQQQVLVAPQQPLINPSPIPMPLPLGEPGLSASASAVAAGQPRQDVLEVTFLPSESKLAQPVVAKSDSIPSSHVQDEKDSPKAASVLPLVPHALQTATNLSNASANGVPNTVPSTLSPPPSTNASVFANAVQKAVPGAVSSAAPSAVPSDAPTALPIVDSSAVSRSVATPASSVVSGAIQKTLPDAIPSTVPTALPAAFPSALPTSPVVPNAIADTSSNAAPAPVLHEAVNPSPKGEVAPKSSSVSTSQNPPLVTPDPSGLAAGLSVSGTTADQLVALIQPADGLLVAAQASAWSVSPAAVAKPSATAVANGKDAANNAGNDATGLKQHASAASDVTASPTGSQGTTQSGDQSQGNASQQGQSAVPAQVNFANHTIAAADRAQDGGVAAPLQTAPTPAGVTAHTAKTVDPAAPATIALPQAVPVINTAKLIQTMGQSEMRVAMRSNEFGNISINTAATRDLISAQISVDHGELARTLAAHLPEMQARLGGNQAMDVRIDMNGQATGQGAGTPPGMSNGSPDGSRGDRQQKGSATSSQSADGFAGQGSSIAAAGLPSGEGRLDSRLDIRV